jgi:hypothetical protein
MGQFPKSEPNVATLAEEMIAGFTAHADIYPAPPVDIPALTDMRDAYVTTKNTAVAAQTTAVRATATKDGALDSLIEAMKKNIRYAENTVGDNDDLLGFIGWSGRKTPEPLAAPGQAKLLVATRQEDAEVDLAWEAPDEGGKPSAYRVVRRERPAGPWMDVATALETKAFLVDQPRGKEFEFRVIAINKAGEGEPSNTVVIVL